MARMTVLIPVVLVSLFRIGPILYAVVEAEIWIVFVAGDGGVAIIIAAIFGCTEVGVDFYVSLVCWPL